MEVEPQSLALRAMVNVDIFEFLFIQSYVATWTVQFASSLIGWADPGRLGSG